MKIITIDNLYLEMIHPAHSQDIFRLIDSNRDHLGKWFQWINRQQNINDTRNLIEACIQQYHEGLGVTFCMVFNKRLAGLISYYGIDKDKQTLKIGYWLGKAFEGYGLVSKSCMTLLAILFNIGDFKLVTLACRMDNLKSCSVAERLNFKITRFGIEPRDLPHSYIYYNMDINQWNTLYHYQFWTINSILHSSISLRLPSINELKIARRLSTQHAVSSLFFRKTQSSEDKTNLSDLSAISKCPR